MTRTFPVPTPADRETSAAITAAANRRPEYAAALALAVARAVRPTPEMSAALDAVERYLRVSLADANANLGDEKAAAWAACQYASDAVDPPCRRMMDAQRRAGIAKAVARRRSSCETEEAYYFAALDLAAAEIPYAVAQSVRTATMAVWAAIWIVRARRLSASLAEWKLSAVWVEEHRKFGFATSPSGTVSSSTSLALSFAKMAALGAGAEARRALSAALTEWQRADTTGPQ